MRTPSQLLMTIALSISFAGTVHAEVSRMDAGTHTVVIEKLEKSLKEAREDETVSLRPVRIRLADLYADRARLRSMEEAKAGCDNCQGSVDDRRRALNLYTDVYKVAEKDNKGPVLLQMAHLHSLLGEQKTAEKYFTQIVNEGTRKHAKKIVAQAFTARAEVRFSQGDFKKAQRDFESAMSLAERSKRGYLHYRIAWCLLNQGQQEKAVDTLVHILQTPELLEGNSSDGEGFDASFHEDVIRDLATFMARGEVGTGEIRLLGSLAPDATRIPMIRHLATECERLGKRRAALQTWGVLLEEDLKSQERLEALVRMARLRFDEGDKVGALTGIEDFVTEWKKSGCSAESECRGLQNRLGLLIMDWSRLEKKNPTPLLLNAFFLHLSVFEEDAEMNFKAASIAGSLKRYKDAARLYRKSAILSAKAKTPELRKVLDASLVGAIEMAEKAKDIELREVAYDHYLELNPKGDINHKVRYQRARIYYEKGQSGDAAVHLNNFATSDRCVDVSRKADKKEDLDLCVKAADLALDSLALIKNDERIEEYSLKYASLYRVRKLEYLKLSRAAVVRQVAIMAAVDGLKKMNQANMDGADVSESIKILKIKSSLAQKTQNLEETKRASDQLLAIKTLNTDDREYALSQLAWVHEMNLDFGSAYKVSRQMKMASLSAEDRAMRLSLLAELAGQDPRQHEEEFMRLSKNQFKKAVLRAKMIRSSRQQIKEFKKYEADLLPFPEVHAALAVDIYSNSFDRKFANHVVRKARNSNEPNIQLISRALFIEEFSKLDRKISNHQIRSMSEFLMQKTLSDRMEMLKQTETMAARAIERKDWLLQLLALSTLSREQKRIYDDILALPIPRSVRGKDREIYKKSVKERAEAFRVKHMEIEKKVSDFWKNSDAFKAMYQDFENATPSRRMLIGSELKAINKAARKSKFATTDLIKKVDKVLGRNGPNMSDVVSARRDVRQNPFSEKSLSRLRGLEAIRGESTMVIYLDARMARLKEGVMQ